VDGTWLLYGFQIRMQARDEDAKIKRARLEDAIERAYEDVAAGKVIRLEGDDQIDAFFTDL
jgi:RecJ-like exonuclease